MWKATITTKEKEALALPAPQPETPTAGEGIDLYRKTEAAGGKLEVKEEVVKNS